MDNRPIGVFDSGLGGLTSVRELRRLLPGEDIVYFGDTGRVPYGSRSHETILQYARQDIAFLLSQNVKCIMAACGTVSSTYPPEEAAKLPVPYMGVVSSAARRAARATRSRKIGVIGTSGHHPLPQLRADAPAAGAGCRDHRAGLPPLCLSGGKRLCGRLRPRPPAGDEAGHRPVFERGAGRRGGHPDLGCTHYPLLAGMIGAYMGPSVAPDRPRARRRRRPGPAAGRQGAAGRPGTRLHPLFRQRRARQLYPDGRPVPGRIPGRHRRTDLY